MRKMIAEGREGFIFGDGPDGLRALRAKLASTGMLDPLPERERRLGFVIEPWPKER